MPVTPRSPSPARPAPSPERYSKPPAPLSEKAALKDYRPTAERGTVLKTDTEVQQAQAQAEAIKNHKKTTESPREAIKKIVEPAQPLSATELAQLKGINTTLAQEAKDFSDYSTIVNEARDTNRTIEEVCKSHGVQRTDFNKSQEAVINRMMTSDYITGRIPNYAGMQEPERRAAVEAYIAANPGVREVYLTQMQEVARDILKRAEDPTQAATNSQTERVKQLDADREVEEKKMNGKLKRNKDLTDDEVKALFDGGKTVEQAEMALLDKTLEDSGIKPAEYAAYQEQQRMQALENDFQEAHKKGPHANSPFDRDGYINGNPGDPKVAEYKRLQARKPTQPVNFSAEDQQKIKAAEDAVLGEVKYVRGAPVTTGGVRQELQRIHDNLEAQQKEAGKKINVSPEAQGKADLEKAALEKRMAEALEKSVETALMDTYDQLEEGNKRKIEADAQDAGEREEDREKEAILAVHKIQGEHGVKTGDENGPPNEKGKKVINRTDIGKDVRRLAQDGEEGLKRIELRNLTEGNPPVIRLLDSTDQPLYVDEKGKPCAADYAGRKTLATWETVNYSQLSQADRDLLDNIHQSQGARLEQKILVDYFIARKPPMDRWNILTGGWKDVVMKGQPEDLKLTNVQESNLVGYIGKDAVKAFFKDSRNFTTLNKVFEEMDEDPNSHGSAMALLMALIAALAGGLSLGKKKREDFI